MRTAFRITFAIIGLGIIVRAIYYAIVGKRDSILFTTLNFKGAQIRYLLLVLVDMIIGAGLIYRCYIGGFVYGSSFAILTANYSVSIGLITGVNELANAEADDFGLIMPIYFFCFLGALIFYYGFFVGVSLKDISDLVMYYLNNFFDIYFH